MEFFRKYFGFYLFVCAAAILGALLLSRAGSAVAVAVSAEEPAPVVVIDAGHGGEDGGARSLSLIHI